MSDPIDALIMEIAVKHGIAVSREDPILVLHTINSRLMEDSMRAQQEQLESYRLQMEDVSLRWARDAKEKAERIVNASLEASRETLSDGLDHATKAAADTLRRELDAALAKAMRPVRAASRIAALNFGAAAITLAAAAAVVWTTLHR